ncbi:MAG: rhodanese-like domain-containing protein [Clostridia bacterium]|nr:rhodanese-like domain-containing protein [Clostridia bacterium]
MTQKQAHDIFVKIKEAVMIDVREEEEYITGHAIGARMLPLGDISSETVEKIVPRKDTPIILYCRSGARSAVAAQMLDEMGYTRVFDAGGLLGWQYGLEHGYEI